MRKLDAMPFDDLTNVVHILLIIGSALRQVVDD
jgi:hypothetical protein